MPSSISKNGGTMILAKAILCLALTIYHEARGEPELGQKAVAYVTYNRAETPNDICKVVYEKNQYSWTSDPKLQVRDKLAFSEAKQIAVEVLHDTRRVNDPTKGATHFHNHKVKPAWSKRFKRTLKVGNHTFYKPRT